MITTCSLSKDNKKQTNCCVATGSASGPGRQNPSPVFVVDDHVNQRAQRSGELRWVGGQLLSRRAAPLPLDLLSRLLAGLQLFARGWIALAFLQADVFFHLPRGAVLCRLRLERRGGEAGVGIAGELG